MDKKPQGIPKFKSKLQPLSSGMSAKRAKLDSTNAAGASKSAASNVPSVTRSALRNTSTAASAKSLFTVGSKSVLVKGKAPVSKSKPTTTATTATKSAVNPKRAAWDTKGRLEDLQKEFVEFRQLMMNKENETQQVMEEKQQTIIGIESKLGQQMRVEGDKHQQEIADSRKAMEIVLSQKADLQRELTAALSKHDLLKDQNEQLNQELRLEKKESSLLRLNEKELKFDIKNSEEKIHSQTGTIGELGDKILHYESTVNTLEDQKREHEQERRNLHNTIQELKGNIRVFCRIRPPLSADGEQQEIFSFPDLDCKKISLSRPQVVNESMMSETLRRTEKLDFSFDKVFDHQSGQAEVFDEISQLVQSALDGYNVCIFAYGQTGSGKTYTMQGPERMDDTTQGMIPRSISQIFKSASQLQSIGWQYKMEASFLEIYNETIHDLLGQPGKPSKHEIKTASGEVVITNLTIVNVTMPSQVENLFETATRNRHVGETMCNARSSRSHSVFTLKISGHNEVTSETCAGTLNLVDLAGSERLKESKAEGDRLKETQCINTSLSSLGNVIMSLANKKSHIPYRDSKLTYLLQNSLGGNSKTLMFVNISPNEDHLNESINSLRFATKVNNCSIGTAKKVAK